MQESFSFSNVPQQFWENFFDTSADWEVFINKEGGVEYSSPACSELTGYSREEFMKDPDLLLRCASRKYQDKFREFIDNRLTNDKEILSIEYQIRTRDKQLKWAHTHSQPVFSPSGKFLAYRLSTRNVTEDKKKNLHLLKLNEQQNVLIEVTRKAISVEPFDTRIQSILEIVGKYTNASRAFIFEDNENSLTTSNTFEWCNKGIKSQKKNLQNFEYSLIPSWNRFLNDIGGIIASDIRDLPSDIFDALNPQGIKSILILPLTFRNRRFGFVGFDECNENKVWDEDTKNLLRTVSNVLTNTINRKVFEDDLEDIRHHLQIMLEEKTIALEKSENYFKTLINNQPDLVCRWLPDTTLTFVNDAYCRFFNVSSQDIIGRKWIEFLESDVREKLGHYVDEAMKTGKSSVYEHATKNYNSELHWHQWINTPLKEHDGNISEFQSTGRDITENIKYQEELKAAKELAEGSDQLKSEFLRLISHELRTPLNAILGFSDLINETDAPAKTILYNNYINQSGVKLLRMIEDVLTMTNLQSGKTPLRVMEFKLYPEMEAVFEKFRNMPAIQNQNIKFKLDYPLDHNLKIKADKEKLIFILNRLLDNAFMFCVKGKIEFGVNLRENKLAFFVKDTGVGIAEINHATIFEAFRKINSLKNNLHEGLGTSLYIVKKLVELMKGYIWVESEINKGASFYFTVTNVKTSLENRVNEVKIISSIADDSKNLDLEGKKILIAEDIESNFVYLEEALKATRASILWAKNGNECLSLFKSNTDISCILMDILMPEMDGYEACREIRKVNRDIPIIAQTAYAMHEDINDIINSGDFNDYLVKPVWKHDLYRKLKNVIYRISN